MVSKNLSSSDHFYQLVLDIAFPKPISENDLDDLIKSWKVSDKAHSLLDQLRSEGAILGEEIIHRESGYRWVVDFNSRFISGVFDGALASSFDEVRMRQQGFVPTLTIRKLWKTS